MFEKLSFLSICSTNFNEFFQVRVAALNHQLEFYPFAKDISQKQIREILSEIHEKTEILLKKIHSEIKNTINSLEKLGIFYKNSDFNFKDEKILEFLKQLKIENHGIDCLENQKTYIAFKFKNEINFVQVPKYRIFWIDEHTFTTFEDLILNAEKILFPNAEISASFVISVDRDSDLCVTETENQLDFINEMENTLKLRKFSKPTRILINPKNLSPEKFFELTGLKPSKEIFFIDGFVHPEFLIGLKKGYHKYDYRKNFIRESDNFPDMMVRFRSLTRNHRPCDPEIVTSSIFSYLDKRDLVVHFPYESYFPVLKFISDATEDKDVSEIKITIYRTEHNSRIVNELVLAALKGKKVTVFMEIKARFNERLNIDLGKILEDAGVKVIYLLRELKVHAKMALVVRKNSSYVNFSTGNFNSETSYIYSDIAVFTSKKEFTDSAEKIFSMIENQQVENLNSEKVFISPIYIKQKLIEMIRKEAENPAGGKIVAKMNNLGDEEIIRELKMASQKGVKILLNVRGICQMLPDENIKIVSIVGKYLEHSRIFMFNNSDDPKIFISSSDWMPRNLDRRLEVMFEIIDTDCFDKIREILMMYFKDDSHSHEMQSDGTWKNPLNPDGFCVQEVLERFY